MDDQREDHPHPKRYQQRNRPQQLLTQTLQTLNVPSGDVENTDETSEGRNFLLVHKPQCVPRGTEKITQGEQSNWTATIHWSTYSQGEQNETKEI